MLNGLKEYKINFLQSLGEKLFFGITLQEAWMKCSLYKLNQA